MAPLNLLGKNFHYWKVLAGPILKRGRRYWNCECVCGNTREVDGSNLKNGVSKSCGCQSAPHTSSEKHKAACAANSRTKAKKLIADQLNRVVKTTCGCWEWQGVLDKDGYGKAKRYGKTIRAHRLFYEEFVSNIPHGMLVLHNCDNPKCCNPEHLFIGTQLDNERDKDAKGRRRNGYGLCKQTA